MVRILPVLSLIALLAFPAFAGEGRPPNIVFVLADDLGYGDLGCFGQTKIRTPNLDRLAAEGVRLTQHYSGNAVCAPSRCVLLTGKHPGHAFIRDNREAKPEGQLPLPSDETTLAELLKSAGYATAVVGKWGLGPMDSEGSPLRQGFERFYGYNCQRQAHNYHPAYLYDNDARSALRNPGYAAHQKLPADADKVAPASYSRYGGPDFAPDLMLDAALKFVDANKARPFFLYFATPIPHLALQVPEDSLAEYAGAFDEQPYAGERGYLPHRTPRAAYAAMVTRMDRDIGTLMKRVKEHGLDENTIFVFSSDNGPLYDGLGGTDEAFFRSAGGLTGRKGSLHEGGIRVPAIVRWPEKIRPGVNARVSGFEDWLPTLLELAGRKDLTPAGIDGISLAPALAGQAQEERPFLYREFAGYGGWQSVRSGDWKLIVQRLAPRGKDAKNAEMRPKMELYNLKDDPAESNDLARKLPEKAELLLKIAKEQHRKSKEFPLAGLGE